jgi:hypothetical protein
MGDAQSLECKQKAISRKHFIPFDLSILMKQIIQFELEP